MPDSWIDREELDELVGSFATSRKGRKRKSPTSISRAQVKGSDVENDRETATAESKEESLILPVEDPPIADWELTETGEVREHDLSIDEESSRMVPGEIGEWLEVEFEKECVEAHPSVKEIAPISVEDEIKEFADGIEGITESHEDPIGHDVAVEWLDSNLSLAVAEVECHTPEPDLHEPLLSVPVRNHDEHSKPFPESGAGVAEPLNEVPEFIFELDTDDSTSLVEEEDDSLEIVLNEEPHFGAVREIPEFLDDTVDLVPPRVRSLSERDADRALIALGEARSRAERGRLLRVRSPQGLREFVLTELPPVEVPPVEVPPVEVPPVEVPPVEVPPVEVPPVEVPPVEVPPVEVPPVEVPPVEVPPVEVPPVEVPPVEVPPVEVPPVEVPPVEVPPVEVPPVEVPPVEVPPVEVPPVEVPPVEVPPVEVPPVEVPPVEVPPVEVPPVEVPPVEVPPVEVPPVEVPPVEVPPVEVTPVETTAFFDTHEETALELNFDLDGIPLSEVMFSSPLEFSEGGSLDDRIERFSEAAKDRLEATEVAVCDRDGFLLHSYSENGQGGALETALLLEVSGRTNRLLGIGNSRATQVSAGGGIWRCLIRGEGDAGDLYAGFCLQRPLDHDEVDFWTSALAEVMIPSPVLH